MKKLLTLVIILICIFAVTCSIFFIISQKKQNDKTENKTANIVFTSDLEYKSYLKVALKSAIMNKNKDSVYNINILCVDLPESDMKSYEQMSEKNVYIKSIPVTQESIKAIGDFPVSNHVSRADLFKFIMPEIFPEYDKILYLDSDIIVLGDLLDLYNTNIDKYYIGAVYKYTPVYNWHRVIFHYFRTTSYEYNCGVMLFNLKKMREDKITSKLINSKNNDTDRVLMTQSAFNDVIPARKIKKLSPVYNFISRWKDIYFVTYDFKITYSPYLNDIDSFKELEKQAVIVHFAGKEKPWFEPNVRFGKEWWEYARMVNKNWKQEIKPQKFMKQEKFIW